MNTIHQIKKAKQRHAIVIAVLLAAVIASAFLCLFVGVSNMTFSQGWEALWGDGSGAKARILRKIRLPRVLAAVIAGAGLSLSGLIMQTTLNNAMASPATLGVSNAAVFGANLSLIAFSGSGLATDAGTNPYATGVMAFVFATASILLILGLCTVRSFSPHVVVLAGMAISAIWTAATTILQYFATDVGLSAAVVWSFGDLSRATYDTNIIMAAVVAVGLIFFLLMSWRYNALLGGEATARTMGIHVSSLRFVSLLLASLITAVCVSVLGVIGFVGVICPHVTKKLVGQDHRVSIPVACLSGSLLLLLADTLSRSVGGGSALPVGAITSLLGAPFFLTVIFAGKEAR